MTDFGVGADPAAAPAGLTAQLENIIARHEKAHQLVALINGERAQQ